MQSDQYGTPLCAQMCTQIKMVVFWFTVIVPILEQQNKTRTPPSLEALLEQQEFILPQKYGWRAYIWIILCIDVLVVYMRLRVISYNTSVFANLFLSCSDSKTIISFRIRWRKKIRARVHSDQTQNCQPHVNHQCSILQFYVGFYKARGNCDSP